MEFSAKLLLNSSSGYSRNRVSFLHSVSAYWQALLSALEGNGTDSAASILLRISSNRGYTRIGDAILGHTRLGPLPKSKSWNQVVESLTGSGSRRHAVSSSASRVNIIAAETLKAARSRLARASNDSGCSVYVLPPYPARSGVR